MLGLRVPFILSLLLALEVIQVYAQNVIQVQVGDEGLFFVPPTVNASVGDIVSFLFVGKNHSVTQSSRDDPCTPLDGGFNSGLLGIGNATNAIPGVWNLTITDDSTPIWYFCEVVSPSSHCASGMVGAINAPSNDSYNAFQSSAKAVTATVSPTIPVALSGVGAVASISPTTTGTLSSTSSSSSTSPAPTTTSSSPTTGSTSSGAVPPIHLELGAWGFAMTCIISYFAVLV